MPDSEKLANPIVKGFAPDPSVCRVGDDFYLVNSSFEYFPGVPIRHSRNLSNWELIGHCLSRPSQLPLEGQRSSGGIYAPTLRFHNGTFYMVTTNVGSGGNFVVTAKDIRGPWSDPVRIPIESIDPSFFWDDEGTCYVTVNGTTGARQAVINPDTGQVLSDLRVIWPGTGGKYPEGPHLFKRDGLYYLSLAEGGTEYGHMQTIARAASPWGPFESCPHNPMISHRSLDLPVQAVGHADLFDDAHGNWWAVCLGIRPKGYPYGHVLGRETFLAPVRWTADGWPVVGEEGRIPMVLDLPATSASEEDCGDFQGGKVPLHWSWLRNPDMAAYQPAPEGGIRLMAGEASMGDVASPTWIGRTQAHHEVEFSVDCLPELGSIGEGGISVRMNESHRIECYLHDGRVRLRATVGPLSSILADAVVARGEVTLSVHAHPDRYEFSAAQGGTTIPLGSFPSHYLATEVAGGFTGVMLGIYAHSPSGEGFLDVKRYRYLPES